MPSNNEEEEYEYYCTDCSEGLYDDSAYYSEYDCEYRCRSCNSEHEDDRRNSGYIMDYGVKFDPYFGHDDGERSYYVRYADDEKGIGTLRTTPLYMGYELECECVEGDRDEGALFVLQTVNRGADPSRGLVYLKEDGSLDHGFEIVSHPATLGFYMNHFPWEGISGLRRMGFNAWKSRTCGLHIHVSRSAFTDDKHLTLFVKFLYDNRNELVQFAGRNSDRYASWDKLKFTNGYNDWGSGDVVSEGLPKFIKSGSRNNDRFTAVNLRNRDTVELRFFRPSLRPETVQAALMMCDAIHQYTNVLTIPDLTMRNALSYRSFRSWLDTQDGKYQLLAERIDARNDI